MGAGIAVLLFFFVFLFALVLLPLIVHVWALIDVSQTRDDLFGPPWDNTKQDWTLGLAVAFMVPFGHIVAPILWWTQVRGPKLRGERPQRPFWSGPPKPMPPAMGPSYPGYGPQQSASPAQQPAYGPQQGGPGQPPQRPPWT